MRNGFNLLDELMREVAFGSGEAFLSVAFQMPDSLIDPIADMFGIADKSRCHCLDEEWMLAGYDVVDIRTQSSVLHSAEFLPTAYGPTGGCLVSALNQFRILADQKKAIDIAVEADLKFPEHAPFSPCAVWIKLA
ncbi:hypothetical protein HPT27_06195 [Permianibacter sp. IMCC34836]|uniref:hypothetical protein n=1 Tax=Permianibacter fluminis TaxID=2738515 RepID=UPI00155567BC|nr:hypothetical protein [Permianibacter fluminis]NQD36608.1 hypothetical protein [Permianibacter fluminis]